jgi:hypothetical protein
MLINGMTGWIGDGPNSDASNGSDHRGAGSGGRNRSAPTGGLANGTPLKAFTRPDRRPAIGPHLVSTTGLDISKVMLPVPEDAYLRKST